MEPTKAPWADPKVTQSAAAQQAETPAAVAARRGVHTGTPVKPLIESEPQLPDVLPLGQPPEWQPAQKRIQTPQDVNAALKGTTLRSFVAFVLSLSQAVHGLPNAHQCKVSETSQAIMRALDRLSKLCADTPAVSHAVRYGNPAYRSWFDSMQQEAPELVYDMLGDELGAATVELVPYFIDSFGNRSRIDYGTGHETTFLMLLYCLFAIGVLKEEDRQAAVLHIFRRYVELMRQLQTTYWRFVREAPCNFYRLEPAGSHGVWGLDEYHFFPFVFGSSQLQGHPSIRPDSITKDDVLEAHGDEYMYLDAVRFVRHVKKGPLHETSPMLYDISGVPHWAKVNQGLFKMYQVEVLSKFPIMQHSLWGHLLPFPGAPA